MTNKEAKEIIKSECYIFNPLDFDKSTRINTALDMAIEALEQEPILDKIRAEIMDTNKKLMGIQNFLKTEAIVWVLSTSTRQKWRVKNERIYRERRSLKTT